MPFPNAKTRRFAVALLIALISGLAITVQAADESTPNPIAGEQQWQRLAEELSLNESQQAQLDDIANNYRSEIVRLDSIGADLRQRIHNIDYGALGLGEILGISTEMGRIASQKTETMLKAKKAFFDILEPEQKSALIELRSRQRDEREQFLRGMMAAPEQ